MANTPEPDWEALEAIDPTASVFTFERFRRKVLRLRTRIVTAAAQAQLLAGPSGQQLRGRLAETEAGRRLLADIDRQSNECAGGDSAQEG